MELEPPAPGRKKEKKVEDEVDEVDVQLAVLSYLPVLCLVSVIAQKREEFVTFHARQGLCLFALELAAAAAYFVPVVGPALSLASSFACLAITVLAIRTARRRGRWPIPMLSAVAEHIHI